MRMAKNQWRAHQLGKQAKHKRNDAARKALRLVPESLLWEVQAGGEKVKPIRKNTQA